MAPALVVYERTPLWNQKTIYFYFLDGTAAQKQLVKKHASIWEKYSGIQFVFSDKKLIPETEEKYYKITFKGNSNQSHTGAVNGTIKFGRLVQDELVNMEIIQHEFGHMLGLSHEHQRFDRPVSLNSKDLVRACKLRQNQSQAWCQSNFSNITRGEVFIQSGYDLLSVMHYDMESISDNHVLIDDLTDTGKTGLSFIDKLYIAMLYNPDMKESDVEALHNRDLQHLREFIENVRKTNVQKIMSLGTLSCRVLKTGIQSLDGKYCDKGFLVIGSDYYSFPEKEFEGCLNTYEAIEERINHSNNCGLSKDQLRNLRNKRNIKISRLGNCKRLETGETNNQGYRCSNGYSFMTSDGNMVGDKTICYSSREYVYEEMKSNPVCNMDKTDYKIYQKMKQSELLDNMKSKNCQVVKSSEVPVNCPAGYEFTIIDSKKQRPINTSCYSNVYQSVQEMNKISECK